MTHQHFSQSSFTRMGKQFVRSSREAKGTDEFKQKISEPNLYRKTPSRIGVEKVTLGKGKPLCSQYKGIINPPKLNISKDTLEKLQTQNLTR